MYLVVLRRGGGDNMAVYKQFIDVSKKRRARKELLYQVIIDDICDVFEAGDEIRDKFRALIEGKEPTLDKPMPIEIPKVEMP